MDKKTIAEVTMLKKTMTMDKLEILEEIKRNNIREWEMVYVRNRPATELVTLKARNVKLSFDIWLVLYMYFILYFWQSKY